MNYEIYVNTDKICYKLFIKVTDRLNGPYSTHFHLPLAIYNIPNLYIFF